MSDELEGLELIESHPYDGDVQALGIIQRAMYLVSEDVFMGQWLVLDVETNSVRRFQDDEPVLCVADRNYKHGEVITVDYYFM